MSDARVRAHLDQLKAWLSDPTWMPDASEMDAWNAGFLEAKAAAEHGPGWPDLVAQAQFLNAGVQARAEALAAALAQVRQELQNQSAGNQALKAYRPAQG